MSDMATDVLKVAQNATEAARSGFFDSVPPIPIYARPEPNLANRLDALESRVARLEAARVALARSTPLKAAIIGALFDGHETSHEIADVIGKSRNSVAAYLGQLANEGAIERCRKPFYRDPCKKFASIRYSLKLPTGERA